jgi:hypothetical protein
MAACLGIGTAGGKDRRNVGSRRLEHDIRDGFFDPL